MSFVVTVYIPQGIVMAADSRQVINVEQKPKEGAQPLSLQTISSDYTNKVFILDNNVGVSVLGEALLGGISMESHLKRLTEERLSKNDDPEITAVKIMNFFKEKFPQADTSFHVCGFKKEGKISVPYVYALRIVSEEIKRLNFHQQSQKIIYGCAWGGESDVITTILKPHTIFGPDNQPRQAPHIPIIYESMNLQDAIDFAIYSVRTTIDTIRFQLRPKTVGGAIDVLLITPEEAKWIQRKQLHGQ